MAELDSFRYVSRRGRMTVATQLAILALSLGLAVAAPRPFSQTEVKPDRSLEDKSWHEGRIVLLTGETSGMDCEAANASVAAGRRP